MEKIFNLLVDRRLLIEADAIGFLNLVGSICIFHTNGGYFLGRVGIDRFLEPIAPEELPHYLRELAASLQEAANEIELLLSEDGEK